MIPELGHFALILALLLALVQGTLPILGAAHGVRAWMGLARPAAQAQFVFIALAFACLAQAFVGNDFSVLNVATHSNSQLPLHYRFAATWGSHQGSMLLWVLMLGTWTAAVTVLCGHLPEAMVARVLGVLGLVSAGFLVFLLLTSNPFERQLPAAADGNDLNPVLQDWGMVIHPPLLYMGYVGFAVAFAFAVAALLGGSFDAAWARWSRPWTTAAWCFLTTGIALGSWWAYRVLGWGGWWFWDPVENASFMPWLAGTALIHSLAVTDKRGAFRSWTVLLAIGAFSLSLIGTFLVRSGVLASVHAFAADPRRGVVLLAFLCVVIGGSLALFAWRAPRLGLGGRFEAVSRETLLLANNVLLMVAMATVLLGTLYPLVLDGLGLGKISVGAPYFEAVLVPLLAALAFLMGVGPLARWKQAGLPDLAARLKWAFAVSAVTALGLPVSLGAWSPWVSAGLLLATWIAATSALNLAERVRGLGPGLAARLAAQPRAYYGMLAAHCGVAVFIVGVTLVKGYETERDLKMAVGDSVAVGGYGFRFNGTDDITGPNYSGVRATVEVVRDGRRIEMLYPEKRTFNVQRSVMTQAAIRSGPFGDLYVSLGEPLAAGAWSVRVYVKPFVGWIWGGCFLMAFGGALALTDRRYRQSVRQPDLGAAHAARTPHATQAT
jgi:cytochrome c-type biogenesis protein CcmF